MEIFSALLAITTLSGYVKSTLQWHHKEHDGVLNDRRLDCMLNRLFGRRRKIASKLHVTGLCGGNPPVTGGLPSQKANYAENVSIWWRHHEQTLYKILLIGFFNGDQVCPLFQTVPSHLLALYSSIGPVGYISRNVITMLVVKNPRCGTFTCNHWYIFRTGIQFRERISNYMHTKLQEMITNPCPNINGGLCKPPLTLGYWSVITSSVKNYGTS